MTNYLFEGLIVVRKLIINNLGLTENNLWHNNCINEELESRG